MLLQPRPSLFSEADREALNKLLQDPLLSAAINVAIRSAQPNAATLAKCSPEQQASIANQLAGMSELVRRLQDIATPIKEVDHTKEPDLEWTHLDEEGAPNNQ